MSANVKTRDALSAQIAEHGGARSVEEAFNSLYRQHDRGGSRRITLAELQSIVADQVEAERQKREAAEKACAEMRTTLELCLSQLRFVEWNHYQGASHWQIDNVSEEDLRYALRGDCGKDYIHKDALKLLVEALKEVKPVIQSWGHPSDLRTLENAIAHGETILKP